MSLPIGVGSGEEAARHPPEKFFLNFEVKNAGFLRIHHCKKNYLWAETGTDDLNSISGGQKM